MDEDCTCDDADEDGYCSDEDCDDLDHGQNPGADEICDDGTDNDCDGEIDEEACSGAGNCKCSHTSSGRPLPAILLSLLALTLIRRRRGGSGHRSAR